jgi:hypothetical protein
MCSSSPPSPWAGSNSDPSEPRTKGLPQCGCPSPCGPCSWWRSWALAGVSPLAAACIC